jgi:hypothetical protein
VLYVSGVELSITAHRDADSLTFLDTLLEGLARIIVQVLQGCSRLQSSAVISQISHLR